MPAVSKKQQNFMQAVANSPKFADKVGVNQSIGREFTKEKDMNKRTKHIMNEKDEIRRVDKEIRKNEGYATGGMLAKTGGSNAPMDAKGKKMMKGGKVKKMNMGGRAMNDRDGSVAMDPKMQMAMAAQQKRAAMGGMMKGGKVGYKAGGMMKDKEGRAMAMNKKDMTSSQMDDAAGRAMKKGGKVKKQGYNARLDDSLGARKGKKKQSMASRRNESKGAKKAAGKKAYSGNRKSAQGKASKRADGIAQRGRTKGRIV